MYQNLGHGQIPILNQNTKSKNILKHIYIYIYIYI